MLQYRRSMPLDRRTFLRTSTVATGVFAFGPAFWQAALAAPATPGPGPYGPPGAPDPVTGLAVPANFSVREIARGGAPVAGTGYVWHTASDGSGCFPQPGGGWILASNSEVGGGLGGASSITFAPDATITGARRILSDTSGNCAGGVTPWGTWLSGEETATGRVWECDPLSDQGVARPAMGRFTHEAVCVDAANRRLYLTEDHGTGCFYRFTPTAYPDLSAGLLEAMLVDEAGRVTWAAVPDPTGATPTQSQVPGAARFQRGEGTWFDEGVVYFVATTPARLYALHVEEQLLEIVYDGSALGLQAELTGIDNVTVHPKSGDVFVSEDQFTDATLDVGLITADRVAARFLTASGAQHDGSELTGPSFDPSGTRLYIASQRANGVGAIYEVQGPFRQERPAEVVTPTPTPGSTPPPSTPGGEADTRRPKVDVRVLGTGTVKAVRRSGLPLAIRADEDVRLEITLRRRKRTGRAGALLARRSRRLKAGKRLKLRLAVVGELPKRQSVPVVVTVRATDKSGNTRTIRRNLRLR
jgi:hypothetical protein